MQPSLQYCDLFKHHLKNIANYLFKQAYGVASSNLFTVCFSDFVIYLFFLLCKLIYNKFIIYYYMFLYCVHILVRYFVV